MKKCILLSLSVFLLTNASAQWVNHPITKTLGTSFTVDDFDNDGDRDYLSYEEYSGNILVAEDLGTGGFSNEVAITNIFNSSLIYIQEIKSANLNNDNLKDAIISIIDYNVNELQTYQLINTGNLQFQLSNLIYSSAFGTLHKIYIDDYDSDNFDDVIIYRDSSLINGDHFYELIEFTNDQNGGFYQNSIGSNINNQEFSHSDKDMDGDFDLLLGNFWYENQTGNFILHPIDVYNFNVFFGSMTTAELSGDLNGDGLHDMLFNFGNYNADTTILVLRPGNIQGGYEFSLQDTLYVNKFDDIRLIDLDMDGDLDIFTHFGDIAYGETNWYENDGSGNFTYQNIHSFYNDNNGSSINLALVDIDQNGYPDPIISSGSEFRIYYLPNNAGSFDRPITININEPAITDFCLVDLDNNNELDIIQGSYEDLSFGVIFSNNSIYTQQHNYLSFENNVNYPFEYQSLNFDNDNDEDIFMLAGDISGSFYLAQFENNNGILNYPTIIDSATKRMESLQIVDWNDDGDLDIMYTSRHSPIAPDWVYESSVVVQLNNGNGTFTKQILFSDTAIYEFEFKDFAAVDYDGDNDRDIILCDSRYNDLHWHENIGTGFTEFILYPGISPYATPVSVSAAKIDGNNSYDIIANYASIFPDYMQVLVYFNNGSGAITNDVLVDYYFYANHQVHDFDNDGDNDIIFSDQQDNLQWYVNDGSGNFTATNLINVYGADIFHAGDINNDGVMDIVAQNSTNVIGGLVWYEGGTSTAGISNHDASDNSFLLFPNPGSEQINIISEKAIESISIHTIDGKLVFDKQYVLPQTQVQLDLQLAKGAYLITIQQDGLTKTEKYFRQ